MNPPRHFLVPTDLSPASACVAGYAVRLAEELGVEVDLLHVFAFPYDWYYWDVPELAALRGAVEESARAKLDALAARLARPSVTVHPHFVVRGSVASVILESAEAESADLVVLEVGDDPRAPSKLGSVAEQVLRCCTRPVLLASHDTVDQAVRRAGQPCVLVPVGDAETGPAALRTALALSAALRGETHVVHVRPFSEPLDAAESGAHLPPGEGLHVRAIDEVLRATAEARAAIGICVAGGDPIEAVVRTASSERADLIVLGTSEWSGTRPAERLALAAPCPLLVVPTVAPYADCEDLASRSHPAPLSQPAAVH